VRVRHKGGSEEFVRAERVMADTWAIVGQGSRNGSLGAALPAPKVHACEYSPSDRRAKHLITGLSSCRVDKCCSARCCVAFPALPGARCCKCGPRAKRDLQHQQIGRKVMRVYKVL
jgi:hypothetical protein